MTQVKELPSISDYQTEDWPANIPGNLLRDVVTNEFTVDPVSGLPTTRFNPSEDFLQWIHELDRRSQAVVINETSVLLSISAGVPEQIARRIIALSEDPFENPDLLVFTVGVMLGDIDNQ